jgi:hypothetical protein
MTPWACGITGCGAVFESAEAAILHQATEHDRQECAVCGTVVPDGYFAIRHAVDEHTRAEYVRAYEADSDAVRRREQVKADIEDEADLEAVVEKLRDRGVLD